MEKNSQRPFQEAKRANNKFHKILEKQINKKPKILCIAKNKNSLRPFHEANRANNKFQKVRKNKEKKLMVLVTTKYPINYT